MSLTEDGRKLVERVLPEQQLQIEQVLGGLKGDEPDDLRRLPGRLGQLLETLLENGSWDRQ